MCSINIASSFSDVTHHMHETKGFPHIFLVAHSLNKSSLFKCSNEKQNRFLQKGLLGPSHGFWSQLHKSKLIQTKLIIFSEEKYCITANRRKMMRIYGFQMLNWTFKPQLQGTVTWIWTSYWLFFGSLDIFLIQFSLILLLSFSVLFVNHISQWTKYAASASVV